MSHDPDPHANLEAWTQQSQQLSYRRMIGATDAGFRIDRRWQPDENKAAFIVATKTDAVMCGRRP